MNLPPPGFRTLGGKPAFRIWGKARQDREWRKIDVFASHRRDYNSSWPAPFFRGTAITWCSQVIAVGWDFAQEVVWEQNRPSFFPGSPSGGDFRSAPRSLSPRGVRWRTLAHGK